MSVLLLTQDTNARGGIGNYFKVLHNRFQHPVRYMITGSRHDEKSLLKTVGRFSADLVRFVRLRRRYSLVHINTSLRPKSLFRDGLFSLLNGRNAPPVLLFIHGWNHDVADTIEGRFLPLYRWIFFRSNAIVVLSREFAARLRQWGYQRPIHVLSTFVDESLLSRFSEKELRARSGRPDFTLLFLARLEREKGIYIAMEVCSILQQRHPVRLLVAGDGRESQNAAEYARRIGLRNCTFLGYIDGIRKREVFGRADLYLFPTFYGEGMPTSVLEAMAFGLPVVTRPVGGLADFFQTGVMGMALSSRDPKDFARSVEALMLDRERRLQMGLHNYRYAREHFTSESVRQRLEQIYAELDAEAA